VEGIIVRRFVTTVAIAFVGLVGLAAPAQAAPPDQPVPTFSCAAANGDGTFTYFFGYTLTGTTAVDIPVGSNNHVTPGNDDQGQPSHFVPGTSSAFTVTTSVNKLTWHLANDNLQASAATLCSTAPVVSESASAVVLPAAVAAPFAFWFTLHRRRARRIPVAG
jgi:hypothetical protein